MKRLIALIALVCSCLTTANVDAQDRSNSRSAQQARQRTQTPTRRTARPGDVPVDRSVQPASHTHGEIIHGGEYIEGDYYEGSSCSDCGGGGCDSCGISDGFCGGCSAPPRFCICFPSHGWVQADYLLMAASGMRLPPLVTTSTAGTAREAAGVLGRTTTSTLFGGSDDYLTDTRSGFRIRFGWWLSALPGVGIEGEYFTLGDKSESFFQQSSGSPILARPFLNVLDGREDSELVAFPNVVSGSMGVTVDSQFDGAAFRFRKQLCCSSGCGFSQVCCQPVPVSSRLDGTLGFRYWELDETLRMQEDLETLTAPNADFTIVDQFHTRNQFNGAEVGVLWQGRKGWWSLDALMRLGIGNVHQTVTISGSTQIQQGNSTSNFDTGFLAQRTNIGTYDRDKFTMVPELGLTLGYQFTRRMRLNAGYNLIYFGNVVRPGDQVDLDVNPNLLAPEVDPFSGPLRPQFTFTETDYWVHGLSLGAEFRW